MKKILKLFLFVMAVLVMPVVANAAEVDVTDEASLKAALKDSSDLSFGNVVGSNIFNTFFILGVATFFVPLAISKDMKKYDIPIMIGIYLMLILFNQLMLA
mgnify:CR=1 FL=1